ncbi:uncharacterized protein LOC141689455 isoform X2 [Apium graveolens]|uniref:uncharacterized protein LOC141689455 isoform X2 n=1 Tax=Apium graveolens TaxID=4045 RepID=UPI003D7B4CAC
MELFLLLQQLFVTAFVTLVVSFLLTRLFVSSGNGESGERGQKGDQESRRLNKVLKVSGTKSKRKRVRFVDQGGVQEFGKVENFSGFEGCGDGVSDDKVENFSGFEGSNDGVSDDKVENFRGFEGCDEGISDLGGDKVGNFSGFEGSEDHGGDKVGNFSGFEGCDEGSGDQEIGKVGDFSGCERCNEGSSDHGGDKVEKFSSIEGPDDKRSDHGVGEFSGFEGLRDGGEVFDGLVERDVGSGEGVGVVEELGVEGGCEVEGGIVDFGFEKSLEKSAKLVSDEGGVGGGRSGLVEMVVESDGNERSLGDRDSSDASVGKGGCEEVVVDECVGGAGVYDQSGEFELQKERSEGDSKERDAMSASFDGGICIEEADNEKKAGLGNDDVLEDQTGEVRVLKDLVSTESVVDGVVKEENVMNTAIDNAVTNKMTEGEVVGDYASVTLARGDVVMDHNEEDRVVKVSQGSGVEKEMDEGNSVQKGLASDEDDDWEGIERSDLEKVFAAAANYVDNGGKADKLLNLGNDEQMQLYGLHKVAMEGPCYEGQPMALKINARAKWVDSCYV